MIGRKPIGISLIVALAAMLAMAVVAASALAVSPQLLNKKGGTALRSVTSAPKNQPDAGEFVNVGEVKLTTGAGTIVCKEMEFGTTVTKNPNSGAAVVLAVPFGVAEAGDGAVGDTGCNVAGASVPTYFDTLANGAVGNAATGEVATVSVTAAKVATVNNLFFSQNVPTVGFCKGNLNGVTGTVANGTEPFGEEGANGLTLALVKQTVPITAPGEGSECKGLAGTNAELNATFQLETPSTATEGWWLE